MNDEGAVELGVLEEEDEGVEPEQGSPVMEWMAQDEPTIAFETEWPTAVEDRARMLEELGTAASAFAGARVVRHTLETANDAKKIRVIVQVETD